MKIEEFENEVIFIDYDMPSPDAWRKLIEVRMFIPFTTLWDDMIAIKKQFWKAFHSGKTYYALPKPLLDKISDLFYNGDERLFDVYFNKVKVSIAGHKTVFLKEVRDAFEELGVHPLPNSVKLRDYYSYLTDIEEEHNDIVQAGAGGHSGLVKRFPNLKGNELDTDSERLRYIRFSHSDWLFPDDEIDNPRYLKLERLLRLGKISSIPNKMKNRQTISIRKAFTSARGILKQRLDDMGFFSPKASAYISHFKRCFSPNAIDPKTKLPIFDENLPLPVFTWDKTNGFRGVMTDPITLAQKPAIRLPDDINATNWQEILFDEFMPLYVQLRDYMIDNKGNYRKPHYNYKTYSKIFEKDFDDWIHYSRVKPATKQASGQFYSSIKQSIQTSNPNQFKKMQEDIADKYKEYIDQNVAQQLGRLSAWLNNKETKYKAKLKSYPLADVMSNQYLDNYIENYNIMVDVYNKKKNTTAPKIDMTKKELARNIAKRYLESHGFHLSIPNEHFRIETAFAEPSEFKERRKEVETKLVAIRNKFKEDRIKTPKTLIILKKSILQGKTEKQLENYYIDIHLNPQNYSNPAKYKQYLEDLITKLPDVVAISKKKKAEEVKKQKEIQAKKQEIEDFFNKMISMEEFKKEITQMEIDLHKKKTKP